MEPFAGRRGKRQKASDEAYCREQEESSLGSVGETPGSERRIMMEGNCDFSFLMVYSHRHANRKRSTQADEREDKKLFLFPAMAESFPTFLHRF